MNNNIPQVVRSVYSNLYFPEIDFWKGYSLFDQIKKKFIDKFRLKGTLKADGIIFENESMQERANSLFRYPLNKTLYVEPSISFFDEKETSKLYKHIEDIQEFKILYLSSWHLNKNIHILPDVANALRMNGICCKFILSLNKGSGGKEELLSKIEKFHVEDYFIFIGKVPAKFVHQVVKGCDAMILLSKLECFSSNIIEAFYFQKPLIISDEPWSKSVCGDSVYYVNRDNVSEIAEGIQSLISDETLRENLISLGQDRLQHFNSPEEKVTKQVQFLEKIYSESFR